MDDKQVKIILTAQDKTGSALSSASAGVSRLEESTSSLASKLKFFGTAAVAAFGAAAAAGISMGLNVAATLQTAEVGLSTLLGSSEAAAATIKRLKVEAARTPFELPGLTQATQLLTSVTKDGNKSIDILLNVGEALAAMGKGQTELDRIIVNLQQIGSVGKASMIDIKQFAFAGIPIFDMLEKHFAKGTSSIADNSKEIAKNGAELKKLQDQLKVATLRQDEFTSKTSKATQAANTIQIENLRTKIAALSSETNKLNATNGKMVTGFTSVEDAIEKGQVTFELLTQMFDEANNEGGQFFHAFQNQAGTFNQALSNMKDSLGIFFADFVTKTGIFKGLTDIMVMASNALGNYQAIVDSTRKKIEDLMLTLDANTGVITYLKETWLGVWQVISELLIPMFVEIWAKHGPLLTELGRSMVVVFGTGLVVAVVALSESLKMLVLGLTTILAFGGKLIDALLTTWTAAINLFAAAWDKAANAIDRVISLMNRAKETAGKIGGAIGSVISGGRAAGGPVSGGSSYLVGEAGPELFTPKVGGTIIPNGRLAGAGYNINISITGNTLLDQFAGEKIAGQIMKAIKANLRL